ncbi:MAG: hypothetical protein ACK4TC_04295 [Sphingomonas pseudosanguinis]|uniref:hypothetical protein n=1 Tax=Sphingomonas pseudosanguinis TaxID=413712 RepID=UPI00391881C9
MDYAALIAFLSGESSPEIFVDVIRADVDLFHEALAHRRQASLPRLEGIPFVMQKEHARRLLEAVRTYQITDLSAIYIANCIVASETIEFADEDVREAVFFLEDDSYRHLDDPKDDWLQTEAGRVLIRLR